MSQLDSDDYVAHNWMRQGACLGSDPALFFPNSQKEQLLIAETLCGQCAVKSVCLDYALENRIDHGVWGGTTEAERRKIIKARRSTLESA